MTVAGTDNSDASEVLKLTTKSVASGNVKSTDPSTVPPASDTEAASSETDNTEAFPSTTSTAAVTVPRSLDAVTVTV